MVSTHLEALFFTKSYFGGMKKRSSRTSVIHGKLRWSRLTTLFFERNREYCSIFSDWNVQVGYELFKTKL